MASTDSKPVKQLKDLLQEQQEPFILEIYLLEKGLNSQVNFKCCHGNSTLKKKKEKSDLRCSKVIRALQKQVVFINERLKTRSWNVRNGNSDVDEENKNKTVFNSDSEETSASKNLCDSQDLVQLLLRNPATDRPNLQPQFLEDPGIHGVADKAEAITATKFSQKVEEDSIFSASVWEILVNSGTQKRHKNLELQNGFLQYSKSIIGVNERKVLFDCITEVLQTRERKKKKQRKVKKWRKDGGNESKLGEEMDWGEEDEQLSGTLKEIEESILEDMTMEIVKQLKI